MCMKKIILLALVGTLRAFPVKVFMDYDREITFDKYTSYAFLNPNTKLIFDLDKRRI